MECIHSFWLLFSQTNHQGQHLFPAKGDIIREEANSRQSSSVALTSMENLPSLLEKINEQVCSGAACASQRRGDSDQSVLDSCGIHLDDSYPETLTQELVWQYIRG